MSYNCHNPILGYSPKIHFFFKIKKNKKIKVGGMKKEDRGGFQKNI
jgi:hypothetical protein